MGIQGTLCLKCHHADEQLNAPRPQIWFLERVQLFVVDQHIINITHHVLMLPHKHRRPHYFNGFQGLNLTFHEPNFVSV